MEYPNCITINQALYFDLFDKINYEWLKQVLDPKIDKDEYNFEVEIEDLPNDTPAWCTTKFTFELTQLDCVWFGESKYITRKFVVVKEYNGSSATAMTLCGMCHYVDDEESEVESDEEEEIKS